MKTAPITHLAAFLVCLIMGTATLLAQEKVELRPNVSPGSAWTFTQVEEVNLDTTMSAGGQQQQMPQKISRTIAGKAEVLEAKDGLPTSMRITFDQTSGGQMEMMGQTQPIPFPLAGQTVTVRVENGNVTHDFKGAGAQDPQVEQALRTLAEMDEHFLPKQPVAVGESWTPDREALARAWQIDPVKNKFDIAMKLEGVREMNGQRVAVLSMRADMAGEFSDAPGLSGQRSIKGEALVDVATGRVVSADATGTIEASGTQDAGGGMQVAIQSKGTMASKMQTQLASAGAGGGGFGAGGGLPGGAGGGAGGGGGPGFGGPIPPPDAAEDAGRAGGPAPAGGAASYAGTFKDDQLKLDLAEQGSGYAGQITMGDQTFPVSAGVQGDRLVGTFESQGHKFEFTATRSGDTVTFITGGTTYTLKTAGGRNPLAR